MKIFLGSVSLLKKKAIEEVFLYLTEKKQTNQSCKIILKPVDSGIPLTPFGKQTYQGAKNRALAVYQDFKNEGDFFVGLENGLIKRFQKLYEECWCVIFDQKGNQYSAYSSGLRVSDEIINKMKQGQKHHQLISQINQKYQVSHNETWGIYSNNLIKRQESLKEAFRNAFFLSISRSPAVRLALAGL